MRKTQVSLLLSVLTISLWLTACGSGNLPSSPMSPVTSIPAQSPPTTLTGNWFLAGSRSPAVYPVVSTSLYVQGNLVTGEAAFSVQCPSAGIITGEEDAVLPISGMIANDGTFQAGTGTITGLSTISLSLSGSSPLPVAPSLWTGTYTIVYSHDSVGIPCDIAQTAKFTATPIAPVTGTYIGVLANPGAFQGPFGPGATVSVQITQGTPVLVTRATVAGTVDSYPIPLTANLTIANSPCALSASTSGANVPSTISGDQLNLDFLVPSSPQGFLSGTLNDPSATTFSADLISVATANGCPGIAFYNFTRK